MTSIALFFLFVTPALYGLNGVLLKRGSMTIPPFAAISISMTVLLFLSVICSLTFEKGFSLNIQEHRGSLVALLFVGFVNTAAFWCLLRAYSYVPVWQYQMFALTTPVFSAIFAYLIIGEALSWRLLVGLVFIGIGLVFALK